MPQEILNIGNAANDGNGDNLRQGYIKCNNNFDELYDIFDTPKFPFTGSGQITGSDGQTSKPLGITGSFSGTGPFNPSYQTPAAIETIKGGIKIDGELRWFGNTTNNSFRYLTKAYKGSYAGSPNTFFEIRNSTTVGSFFLRTNSFITDISIQYYPTIASLRRVLFTNSSRKNITQIYGTSVDYPVIFCRGNSTTAKLYVNGKVTTDEFKIDGLGTTDPNDPGRWFTQTSDQVFGDGGSTKIVCVSH